MSSRTIQELRELNQWIRLYIAHKEHLVVEILRENRTNILKRGW